MEMFGVHRSRVSYHWTLRPIKSQQFSLAVLSAVQTGFGQKVSKVAAEMSKY